MRQPRKTALALRRSVLILSDEDQEHDGENLATILAVECDYDSHAARLDGRQLGYDAGGYA